MREVDKKLAGERITSLFDQANKQGVGKLANRYIVMARKIAQKAHVRIPQKLKRRFCKHCYHFLVPGKNLRIRNRVKSIVYYCLDCKKFMRFPHK